MINKKLKSSLFIIGIIFLFLVSYTSAEDEPSKYSDMIMNITFSSSVTSEQTTDLQIFLDLVPLEDERQEIIDLAIKGNGELNTQKDILEYNWHAVYNAEFGWNAVIKTHLYISEIKHIPFPPAINGFENYEKKTEYIDINSEIRDKANELAAGKNNLYEVAHEIGAYVYNSMTYDLNFVNTQKKASWVMENKRGVCDEYAILFLALVRSLGIPGRYVSGVAYSNMINGFGNHAWAEIYDGNEWIPFDPTYGQLGWLDATHIALSKTSDAAIDDLRYGYTSPKIVTFPLNLNASTVSEINPVKGKDFVEINVEPLKAEVGFNSFVPLKISVKNKRDSYLPLQIHLAKGPEIVGKNVLFLLVPPLKTKSSFFILTTPEKDPTFMYTSTVEIRTQFDDTAITSFDFAKGYEEMNLETAQSLIKELQEPDTDYRYDALLECVPLDKYYYGEIVTINCTVLSKSNTMLNNLNLCIKDKCEKFDLPINTAIEKHFLFNDNSSSYVAKLNNNDLTKTQFVAITLLEKPVLKINNISPKSIDYSGTEISIMLNTKSLCRNSELRLNNDKFILGDIEREKNISIPFSGSDALKNKIDLVINCVDLRGISYTAEKTFEVEIINSPWYAKIWQKIILLFKL